MADPFDAYSPEVLQELGKLSLRLAANEKTRKAHLKNIKTLSPGYQLPADIATADLREELTGALADDKLERERKATEDRIAAQRKSLIDSGRYSEDDVKKIETEVMQKFGLSDYAAAAKIYAADTQPAKPSGREPLTRDATWTLPQVPGLLDDPTKAARNAAYAEIDAINARRVA